MIRATAFNRASKIRLHHIIFPLKIVLQSPKDSSSGCLFADTCVYVHSMFTGAHLFLLPFVCMCVSGTEMQPASWTSLLSSHSASGTGLHSVTQGDTRQPPACGIQEGSPPCHCLSLWLCPLSCPHAGRSREEGPPTS